ncbi:MAG: ATP-binding protein [Treponema sp.]|nr:ATP-binding protein [Treponema sp.]
MEISKTSVFKNEFENAMGKNMKIKSLTFRIFSGIFFVGTVVYFICSILFVSNMYDYFEKQIFNELENESLLLEDYAENHEFEKLEKIKTKNRITLISQDGTVLFDSTKNSLLMENHSNRTEFQKALQNGTDTTVRYSSTMTEKTLYYAKVLKNSDILRISCNQHSVAILVLGMIQPVLIILILAIFFSAVSASFISKKVIEPFNKIDLENPEQTEVYDELKPFTKRIAEENFEKKQREEIRQQFSANVSHELKTPLTSISGFAEILKNGGTDEKTTVDFATTIYNESQRMISLVNDIIKLSKLDEKSICQEKEEISLKKITEEIFNILSSTAKQKNIKLNLKGDSGTIFGVHSVIYEMIYNLVDNAIKYNKPDGSVDVQIETEYAESNGKKIPKEVLISVKDSGIGIPKGETERIFERFYRVDKSRSKDSGGTGLGLSIVKHGAKYHNAQVYVSSEEGKGSTFSIVFNI